MLFFLLYTQMKQPPQRSLSLATAPPIVGKRVKEGLVSQIASRFQNQEPAPEPAPTPKRPERISLDSPLSPKKEVVEDKLLVTRRPVARTESHHTRFNNARALFEKLGSAEELDAPSTPTPPPAAARGRTSPTSRAASANRNAEENGGQMSASYHRARSTSPFASGTRSASVPGDRQPRSSVTDNGSLANGHGSADAATSNGHSKLPNGQSEPTGTGIVKARRLSFQQKQREASESSSSSSPVVNGTAASSATKQRERNWFPSSTGKQQESVESARRTSVKNDNTPNLLSSAQRTPAPAPAPQQDSSPMPPSNLDTPGDRRPLNTSENLDAYMKNWKNSESSEK